jgi:hypothetical protein
MSTRQQISLRVEHQPTFVAEERENLHDRFFFLAKILETCAKRGPSNEIKSQFET